MAYDIFSGIDRDFSAGTPGEKQLPKKGIRWILATGVHAHLVKNSQEI